MKGIWLNLRNLKGPLVRDLLLSLLVWPGLLLANSESSEQTRPAPYQDSAVEHGLKFQMQSGHPTEKTYLVEGMTGGVCLFDYDNDGRLDIYLVNGSTVEYHRNNQTSGRSRNCLFKNLKDGTFADVTDRAGVGGLSWGQGCAAADFDNDGDRDLYVTNLGPNILFENRGDGTFADISEKSGTNHGGWSSGCSWGDYNGDGLLDLYVGNYVELDLTKPPPTAGQNKFCAYLGQKVMCGPQGLPGAADVLYRNQGDGTFVDVTQDSEIGDPRYYSLSLVSFDFDNDADLDIFVANDSHPNLLYQNQGDGTFVEIGLLAGVALSGDGSEQAGMGVALGDYDDDGNLDLFVTHYAQDRNTLYQNQGDGFFLDATSEARLTDSFSSMGWGTAFFDFDCDGWKDLLVVNGHLYPEVEKGTDMSYPMEDFLYRNQRDGTFVSASEELDYEARVGRGAAFGDLNNDGSTDLVISNMDDAPFLLFGGHCSGSHWLLLDLVGTKSNRDAIGARAWLEIGGKQSQLQEVIGGSSYISSSDPRLHFGLGSLDKIEKLYIRWPGGILQILENVEVDQILTVTEPG